MTSNTFDFLEDDADIKQLAAEGAAARLEKQRQVWVEQALSKHPEARPFADLLQGGSLEDIEGIAADVASRMAGRAVQPAGNPPVHVPSGAPVVDPSHGGDDERIVAQSIAQLNAHPFDGDGAVMRELINAKLRQAGAL